MVTASEFAQSWHRLLFEENIDAAWRLMTEDFRRVVAQAVLVEAAESQKSRDLFVEAVAQASPRHRNLTNFFSRGCTMLKNACVVSPEMVGAGETVRFEAPAYEIVRLYLLEDLSVDKRGRRYLASGKSASALTLIVDSPEPRSWLVAGVGAVMAPGWPPTLYWEPPPQV